MMTDSRLRPLPFVALASPSKCRWTVYPLAFLAILPIRWILQVLTGASRSERITLWLAFGYLLLRLCALR